jgi:hypothetical protein
MMESWDTSPGDNAGGFGSIEQKQTNPPLNPAELPANQSPPMGRSSSRETTGHQSTPALDASTYANFSQIMSGDSIGTAIGKDWEHASRISSGSSILDTSSVMDESGRSFHGYKEGKYFLPNDAVRTTPPSMHSSMKHTKISRRNKSA